MGTLVERQVAHVWKRLGFGAVGSDIDAGVNVGVQALIADLTSRPLTTAADWNFTTVTDWTGQSKWLGQQLRQMGFAANPLQERLAWILQGLVVVGIDGTVSFPDMRDHIVRLRTNPFASYKQLLTDVTTLPGMAKYLSTYQNAKGHPNQNYGRELMELFSLGVVHPKTGVPNYTEADVVEVARALTGWTLNWTTGAIYFDATRFDSGTKTFLGAARGNAGIPEVMNALVGHPSWGYHVPRRLYRELVGLEPDGATLDTLAGVYGSSGDVGAVVKAIVGMPAFLSDAAIGAKAKTPVELVVSGAKAFGFDLSTLDLSWQLKDLMNQHPFFPPNVSGWSPGRRWLNSAVAMTWCGIVQQFASTARSATTGPVPQLVASANASTAPAVAARMCGITDVTAATQSGLASYATGAAWNADRAAGLLALVLVSPEFWVC